jgi:hypothetical protein
MRSVQVEKGVCKKLTCRKYNTKYPCFGLPVIGVDGEERPQCSVCMKILAAVNRKLNTLKKHRGTVHVECVGTTSKIANATSKPLFAYFKVFYRTAKCKRNPFDMRKFNITFYYSYR